MDRYSQRILPDKYYDVHIAKISSKRIRDFAAAYGAERVRILDWRGYILTFYGIPLRTEGYETVAIIDGHKSYIELEDYDEVNQIADQYDLDPYRELARRHRVNRPALDRASYDTNLVTVRESLGDVVADNLRRHVTDEQPIRLVQHAVSDTRCGYNLRRSVNIYIFAALDNRYNREYLIAVTDSVDSADSARETRWVFSLLDDYRVELDY